MDTQNTKSELLLQKTDLESKVAELSTKEGADAFIAQEKQKVSTALTRLKPKPNLKANQLSMRDFLTGIEGLLERMPTPIVQAEIEKTQKTLVAIEQDIKQIDEATKPISDVKEIP